MARRPELSKGELEIVRIVWELGEATLGQVFEACLVERKIDYATVQTYLNRLVTKGYLKTRPDGRAKLYRPKVPPSQVIRETVDDLLRRLFRGDTSLLVRHLIDDQKLTTKDIGELRGLLSKLEADNHDHDK